MAKLSFSLNEVEESMKDTSCILDISTRNTYKTLSGGRRNSLMHPTPGRFCVAFPMDDNTGKRICYRVWKEIIPDIFNRYTHIGQGIAKAKLPYFSGFHYIEKALKMKCDGTIMPGIFMDWIEGDTLDKFLSKKWADLNNVQRLTFIRDFYLMCDKLRTAGISHGDLSCANIMINSDRDIRLVDYDSVYVNSMEGKFYQTTGGAVCFQHPERINATSPLLASIDDDNFSQLVIALSLWVAYFEPAKTTDYDETQLLFSEVDFNGSTGPERLRTLKQSKGWQTAEKYRKKFRHISVLLDALECVQKPLSEVPSILKFASRDVIRSQWFYQLLNGTDISDLQIDQKVSYCTACGTKITDTNFDYCTACGTKIHIYKSA